MSETPVDSLVNMLGDWRIRDRGTNQTIAHVRLEERPVKNGELGLWIFWKPNGEGEWVESNDALGLMLGDAGAVERING